MKSFISSLLTILLIFPWILGRLDFETRENDSRLYTIFVQQLNKKPLSKIVTLEWGNNSPYEDPNNPYVRDHLIGQFIPSVILSKLGIDPRYAHYTINQVYRFLFPLIIYFLVLKIFGSSAAIVSLIASHLNVVNLNYVFRANQELPLLFFLFISVYGLFFETRRSRFAYYFGCIGSFLVKGLAGIIQYPIWFIRDFFFQNNKKQVVSRYVLLSLLLLATAGLYELWFRTTTGNEFWPAYFNIQVFGRNPKAGSFPMKSFPYYFSRSIGYALPWFLGCYFIIRSWRLNLLNEEQKKLITTFLSISISYILIFSLFSRAASRYIFPTYFLMTVLGAIGISIKIKDRIESRVFKSPILIHQVLYWLILITNLVIFAIRGKNFTV
ncbi:MAG: hypothetical protein OHK0056_17790 [Bacteriovoracaceae bacterium]